MTSQLIFINHELYKLFEQFKQQHDTQKMAYFIAEFNPNTNDNHLHFFQSLLKLFLDKLSVNINFSL